MASKKTRKESEISFPASILNPVKNFLEEELKRLTKAKNTIATGDPFNSVGRDGENSLEEDVDEQIGHLDAEVKTKFINKQIIQIRQALTRLKIGKYGICENCGRMIDTDRLAASPGTTLCLKCAKEKE